MMKTNDYDKSTTRQAGYQFLLEMYNINGLRHWHQSFVAQASIRKVQESKEITSEYYPPRYWPGDCACDHLLFALKYDGINLALLKAILAKVPLDKLTSCIIATPTGKYTRKLWFLYEFLTEENLQIDDLKRGTYVDLLENELYFTLQTPHKSTRHRINNNLLGNVQFCPTVRRTKLLAELNDKQLSDRSKKIVSRYSSDLLKRALAYLYTKETKSSFEIEHIEPSASKTDRFVELLQLAEVEDFCSNEKLIDLQNRIVDPRFQDSTYRQVQSYVGESFTWKDEKVHFACPKPEDLHSLMQGLLDAHQTMSEGISSAIIHAACISYGFVFLHPFEDGNGRIHRFLIHNILAIRNVTPTGIMFPVSAVMLKKQSQYDHSLESFSNSIMPLIDYTLDDVGSMTVHNQTANWYSYIDMTPQAEALLLFVQDTIDSELAVELDFLVKYDRAKELLQEIVDLPNRKIDLFIRFCNQNNYRVAPNKRKKHFDFLTEEELETMQSIVQSVYSAK